jgi:hypothetical protein
LMHMTDFAPVLSATSSRDCIWIMSIPNFPRGNTAVAVLVP